MRFEINVNGLKQTKIPLFFLLLAVVTVGLTAWQHWGMHKVRHIYPEGFERISMMTDKVNGGRSRAVISVEDKSKVLKCELLLNGFTHPFCAMTYQVSDSHAPLDATEFDYLSVKVEYKSGFQDTLLIYLLNDEGKSFQRANLRPVNVKSELHTYQLPVSSFFVPSWWLLRHNDDPLEGKANTDNISGIQFSSGDAIQGRNVEITVHEIAFHGKLLTKESLYFVLLLTWLVPTLSISIYSIFRTSMMIRAERQRSTELLESNTTLEELNSLLDIKAKTDPLTGALNRAGLEELIASLRQLSDSDDAAKCAVIILDVDNFKQINDTYGHGVGDNILKTLVARLYKILRKTDELIRYGGEEFIIVCRDSSAKEASLIAEKCRSQIEKDKMGDLAVTCSFGVADGASQIINAIIEKADKALYIAKKEGKNRVVLSE